MMQALIDTLNQLSGIQLFCAVVIGGVLILWAVDHINDTMWETGRKICGTVKYFRGDVE